MFCPFLCRSMWLRLSANGSTHGGGYYDKEFPPLKPIKFNVTCGDLDLKLEEVPMEFKDGAIIINMDEEAEAS